MAVSAPVHSKTISKPSRASNAVRTAVAESFALLIWSSEKDVGVTGAVAGAESFEAPLPLVDMLLGLEVGASGVRRDGDDGEGKQ